MSPAAEPVAWVGVDPGARNTGIIARGNNTDGLLEAKVVPRQDDETEVGPGATYIRWVLDGIKEVAAWADVYGYPAVRVAVEGVRRPNPHVNRRNGKATTDPTGIIGAAIVLGGILAAYPDAVIVPPGGNGSGLLATYPPELVTPAERRGGLNRPAGEKASIRHARSAWDVAGAAMALARLGGAA